MDLTWWVVAIGGCLALAGCLVGALLWPMATEHRKLRALANTDRLTRLPEYQRAVRLRTIAAVVSIALLVVIFASAVIAASRPTGLPSASRDSSAAQPEDIMVCAGGPPSDPAVSTALRYFAERAPAFTTQRIGLTSTNRRVVPLTRDYQYAAGQFAEYGRAGQQDPPDTQDAAFAPRVSYVDYAEGVEDALTLCLAGFPSFDEKTAQRRSLIYVGPDALREPGDPRPTLFTSERVRQLAEAGGIQVNILAAGGPSEGLSALARDTGGRAYSADADVVQHLSDIRQHPPAPVEEAAVATRPAESPDVPIVLGLVALAALTVAAVVVRR